MKVVKSIMIAVLILFLISIPVAADAHWRGGGVLLGFGTGLLTGILLAPRPVYVAPPVYAAPPVWEYQYYPSPIPAPPPPQSPPSGHMNNFATPGANPPPSAQAICREWRMIDRHWEDRWDSYYGRWRTVLVEKWGWVQRPCSR